MAYAKKSWNKGGYKKSTWKKPEITGSDQSFEDYRRDFNFTEYHRKIEENILMGGNTFVDAGPGSGKTTTIFSVILPSLISIISENDGEIGGLFAFNKANAKDFQEKVPADYVEKIKTGTIHSVLLSILRKNSDFKYIKINGPQEAGEKFGRYQPEKKGKTREMAENIFPDQNGHFYSNLCRLVSLAKNSAFGIKSNDGYENPSIDNREAWGKLKEIHSIGGKDVEFEEMDENSPDLIESAQKLFAETLKNKSEADFDDMLYFPLYFGCELPDWQFLIMDEGQDIFPITLEFMARMREKGTQIIMVGDKKQAINGFAGSMANAIDVARERLGGKILDMPISFRCSKVAAQKANEIFENSVIPHENALEGKEMRMDFAEFCNKVPEMDGNDCILSRTHKNLIPFAMQFIKQGREFVYKGIRKWANDAKRCLYHAAKMGKDLYSMRVSMNNYLSDIEDKYIGKPKIPKWVIEKRETIETLNLLMAGIEAEGGDYNTLKGYLSKLIAADREISDNCVTLATIHASKGGEWNNVYIVGEMISPLAKTEEELRAEKCCSFVAVTRSRENLIFVPVSK